MSTTTGTWYLIILSKHEFRTITSKLGMRLRVILSVSKSRRKVATTDTKETTHEIMRHKAGSLQGWWPRFIRVKKYFLFPAGNWSPARASFSASVNHKASGNEPTRHRTERNLTRMHHHGPKKSTRSTAPHQSQWTALLLLGPQLEPRNSPNDPGGLWPQLWWSVSTEIRFSRHNHGKQSSSP